MKKSLLILLLIFIIGIVGYGGYFYYKELRGIGPALSEPPGDIEKIINTHNEKIENGKIVEAENDTDFPLILPDNFRISVFSGNLEKARVMVMDPYGDMFVSQTRINQITKLDIDNGKVVNKKVVMEGMNKPHGMAFLCESESNCYFYLAEENQITRYIYKDDGNIDFESKEKIVDLPDGGGHRNHFTRTIKFGPDGRLYVSIGSSCNVCNEEDNRRAKIFSMNPDGSDWKEYASGLRNAVFFAWHPNTNDLWVTEMGRDELGDDIPPDELNIVQEGKNYGWPVCYGNKIHDTDFDKNTYIRNPCEDTKAPIFSLQAHVAPLGISFIPKEGWPAEWENNILVAYHGSWNRSDPVGYKIVRFDIENDSIVKKENDFISGWLTEDNKAFGRPVDVLVLEGGVAYISDDHAGVVYKVEYKK